MADTSPSLPHAKGLKIALCKSSFQGPISGADETLVTYAIELQRAGYDVRIVLLYPFSTRDAFARRVREAGVRMEVIAERAWMFGLVQMARRIATHLLFVFVLLSRFPGHVRRIWQTILGMISGLYYERCREHFEKARYDVVHVVTPDAGTTVLIRAAKSLGVPIVYQELGTPYHMPGLEASYERLQRVLPSCDKVAALSPRLARQWQRKLDVEQGVGVLPLIVASPERRPLPMRPIPFDVVFGFAARLENGKGPTIAVEAFAEVNRIFGRVYLRMAGNGPETYKVRSLSRTLGLSECCEFVGNYSGVMGRDAFMQTLDVFILPTYAEGTPNSLIEAMANGIPVIASGVGGIPDLVTEDCGILVPPGEPMALADAMLKLARDPALRARMGQAGRARYEQLFSAAAVLPILDRTYASLSRRALTAPVSEDGLQAQQHPWKVAA